MQSVIFNSLTFQSDAMKKLLFISAWLISFHLSFSQSDYGRFPIVEGNEQQLLAAYQKSKPGIDRVRILISLSKIHISNPYAEKKDLDNSYKYARQAHDESITIKYAAGKREVTSVLGRIYLLQGNIPAAQGILAQLNDTARARLMTSFCEYYMERNVDSMLWYSDEVIRIAERNNHLELKVLGLEYRPIFYYLKGNVDRSIEEYLRLEKIGKVRSDLVDLQYIYSQLIALLYNKGDFRKVVYYAIEALKVIKKEGETQNSGIIYHNAGTAYGVLQQYEKAIEYFKLTFNYLKKWPDERIFWQAAREMSSSLIYLERANEALDMLLKAKAEKEPKGVESSILMNMAIGTCYRKLKQFEQAEKYTLQALEINKGRPFHYLLYNAIAALYVDMGKYQQARRYLDTIVSKITSKTSKISLIRNYKLNYIADSALGDYFSAMNYLMKVKTIEDSVFEETKNRQMQELEVKYESDKKDADIRIKEQDILLLTRQQLIQQKDFDQATLRFQYDSQASAQNLKLANVEAVKKDNDLELLKKDALIKQSSLKQAHTARNVTFAGIGLLAIILLLLYYQYRLKQRSNKAISQKNDRLQQLVEEKEWLLKEIHHRVKNNLQTVVSLLESQSSYLENDALLAVQNSQHRVYAMSLIHQKLYQGDDMSSINMSVYLPELVNYLSDSFQAGNKVKFNLYVENIELDVSQAIPVGLILNEAITNSLKYAFYEGGNNEIRIAMHRKANGQIELAIADNGIGLPANFRQGKVNSLGIKLMNGLTGDIGGRFNIENKNGTTITVVFANDPVIQHIKKMVTSEA